MTRRKDGLWQEAVPFVTDGRKKYKYFYGRTKKEVLTKIAAYKEDIALGPTFAAVADEWWSLHEKTIEYNTAKQYRPAIRRAKERFGSSRISRLTAPDIRRFLLDCIQELHMADKTARTQLMVVNLICRFATELGYIPVNPAREITVPRGLAKSDREMPSDEDLQRVKTSTDCTFGLFAYWLLYTGLRRSELMALDWSDVDLERRSISVTKSLYQENNRPKLKAPKTQKGTREVPLVDKLLEKITPGKGLVFPDKDGGFLTEMHYQKLWRAYQQESGVTCTAHQLRHAYATMLFEADVNESDAQELLGHAQISTTKDIYTHIRASRKDLIRDKLLTLDIG